MNRDSIIQYLKNNELDDVEEIKYKEEALVVRFIYEFDDVEIDAAKAYANDESEDEEEGDIWYEEFFYPYLSDLAIDNVGEIMEEIMEDMQIDAQYVSYELNTEESDSMEFIAVFSKDSDNIDIEKVLDELNV